VLRRTPSSDFSLFDHVRPAVPSIWPFFPFHLRLSSLRRLERIPGLDLLPSPARSPLVIPLFLIRYVEPGRLSAFPSLFFSFSFHFTSPAFGFFPSSPAEAGLVFLLSVDFSTAAAPNFCLEPRRRDFEVLRRRARPPLPRLSVSLVGIRQRVA